MEFKVGDKVRCIDIRGYENTFNLNDVYIVKQLYPLSTLIQLEGSIGAVYSYRFEYAYIKDFQNKLDLLINE